MTIREVFLDIAGLMGIIWLLFCGFEIVIGKITEIRNKRAGKIASEKEMTESIPESTSSASVHGQASSSDSTSYSPHSEKDIRQEREEANRLSVLETLREMGCQPESEEDGNVVVSFQGERFLLIFNGAFVRIWDLNWMNTKNTDDDYAMLKDALNYANFSFGPAIVMHAPDVDGNIYISSCFDVVYDPEKNDNKEYLVSILEAFFTIKQILHREYMRLKDNPEDVTLNFNPIGFNTATLSDPDSPQAN